MPRSESYGVAEFSVDAEAAIAEERNLDGRLGRIEKALQRLLKNRRFVGEFLAETLVGERFPIDMMRSVDHHDFTICRGQGGSFSLKLYVWLPGARHPIHDHGSWGVFGAYQSHLTVVRFQRTDGGEVDDRATLREIDRFVLKPGQTARILPLGEGIHWTGNDTDSLGLTVHVYGKAMRHGYILGFDDKNNLVFRLGTPKLERTLLAVQALRSIGGEVAARAFRANLKSAYAPVRWECFAGLAKLEGEPSGLEQALFDEDEGIRKKARRLLDEMQTPSMEEG